MKRLVGAMLTLSTVMVTAGIAKADIGSETFEGFGRFCIQVGGTFETWNNRRLGTCVYPGAGSPQNQQDWFWASQQNVPNTLDTYKSGGSFNSPIAAYSDMLTKLRLRCRNPDGAGQSRFRQNSQLQIPRNKAGA